MVDAASFYDDLAPRYHALFQDWWEAALWHGSVVAKLLARMGVEVGASLLDCACGIGTQAIPLAALGFAVTATDISEGAISRARREALERDISVEFAVTDIRALCEVLSDSFDAAIACDNALPHLQNDEDLHRALVQVQQCLVPGGLFLASIRDYDHLTADRPAGVPITLHGPHGERHGFGQSWSWSDDGEFVDITLFTLAESRVGWHAESNETRYRALRRDVLTRALQTAGFTNVEWLMPDVSGYFQPVVIAQKPVAGRQ